MSENLKLDGERNEEVQPEWVDRINRLSMLTRLLAISGYVGSCAGFMGIVIGLGISGQEGDKFSAFNFALLIASVNNLYIASKVSTLTQLEASIYDVEKFTPVSQKVRLINGKVEILQIKA